MLANICEGITFQASARGGASGDNGISYYIGLIIFRVFVKVEIRHICLPQLDGGFDPLCDHGDCAGIMQQYIFYYAKKHKKELD